MATQYTAGLAQGQVLTADIMNQIGAVWEPFTTAWTAQTTNPVLGNGAIGGRYARINKWVIVQGVIIMGSTTTYGTGGYLFSVPIASRFETAIQSFGMLLDASAGYVNYSGGGIFTSATTLEFRLGNAQSVFRDTVPVTVGNADQFRFWIEYEAA